MNSGCSESNACGVCSVEAEPTASCHQTSRLSSHSTSCSVRLTTSTLVTEPPARLRERAVDRGLERGGGAAPVAAVGGDDDLRLGVVDAGGQGVGREPAEHHRVRGADAGAGEHRDGGLGDHRQVDRHPVAGLDAEVGEGVRGPADLVLELGVGDRAGVAGLALEVDRDPVAQAVLDVPVDAVVGDVELAAHEPPRERRLGPVEGRGRSRCPRRRGREPAWPRTPLGRRPPRRRGPPSRRPARRRSRTAGTAGPRSRGSRGPGCWRCRTSSSLRSGVLHRAGPLAPGPTLTSGASGRAPGGRGAATNGRRGAGGRSPRRRPRGTDRTRTGPGAAGAATRAGRRGGWTPRGGAQQDVSATPPSRRRRRSSTGPASRPTSRRGRPPAC